MELEAGAVKTWSRTFTEQDVRSFAAISGDEAAHHTEPDDHGRLIVHGLLTATLPTKLGGDLGFLARTMTFEFLRPVYSGDTITITGVCGDLEEHRMGHATTFTFSCVNQDGVDVMRGESAGVILAN